MYIPSSSKVFQTLLKTVYTTDAQTIVYLRFLNLSDMNPPDMNLYEKVYVKRAHQKAYFSTK